MTVHVVIVEPDSGRWRARCSCGYVSRLAEKVGAQRQGVEHSNGTQPVVADRREQMLRRDFHKPKGSGWA